MKPFNLYFTKTKLVPWVATCHYTSGKTITHLFDKNTCEEEGGGAAAAAAAKQQQQYNKNARFI
jgi:hypothetical protein